MPSNFWNESAVAKINSRFVDCDSEHEHIRQRSEAILCQEINLCMHIGANHVLVDLPSKSDRNENFAAILNRLMQQNMPHLKIILRLTVPGDDA
jgi:endonuclease IV